MMNWARLFLTLTLVLYHKCSGEDEILKYCHYLGDYVKEIQENVSLGTVVAYFKTNGNNSQIDLAQEQNEYFLLDFDTRNITVRKELDADTGLETIDFVVNCIPKARPVSIRSSIYFLVGDVNDNTPEFAMSEYVTEIREDARVGTTVFADVSATDADIGDNGRVYYRIVPGNYTDHFELRSDSEAVIILKKTLDYETVTKIQFELIGENYPQGNSKMNKTTLVVNVLNVDDMSPTFTHSSYSVIISEDTSPGATLPVNPEIHAEDRDLIQADLEYSIVSGSGFLINKTTGEVSVDGILSPGQITLVLEVHQVNDREKSAWAVLKITVQESGSGNAKPTFYPSRYNVTVSELEPVGASLVTVTARDDGVVTYGLSTASSMFKIDPDSGSIRLLKNLDYELTQSYLLEVTASDSEYTATATVSITVSDVNDNNPEVDVTNVEVDVERQQGALVHTIHATDLDAGTVFSYTLVPDTGLFTVDVNGVVRVSGTAEELTENWYSLLVRVRDSGSPQRETSVLILVKLDPIPTLPPVTEPLVTKPAVTTPVTVTDPQETEVTPQAVVQAGSSDLVVIILGVITGILLLIIIILIIFIKRRRIHYREQLNKARIPCTVDPKGLAFKQSISPPLQPDRINFGYDLKSDEDYLSPPENLVESKNTPDPEDRSDGGTTTQENPFTLNGEAVHQQDNDSKFITFPEGENIRDVEEIHIQTAVLPLDEGNDRSVLPNGSLSTFKSPDTDSTDSSDSSSDSKKDLWPTPTKKCLRFKNPSAESIPSSRLSWQGSEASVNGRLNDGTDDKPQITVYF